jgi:phage shock protein PspC (stress-responsive transcriptional regulator)
MKKTHSIHFGRQLFIIEEDAYEQLQQYLERLERSFHGEAGISDIMEDIEMRFAELLLSYLGESRKVVGSEDISRGIASLGEPEVIASDEPVQEEAPRPHTKNAQGQKRLFRDSENGMLGGVSAGLAAYFDIDPTFVRLGFAVLIFFAGMAIPAYIVLWIVLPDAKTPSDRLRMKGQAVTVDSLKEEFHKAADRIKTDTQRARDKFRENSAQLRDQGRSIFRVMMQIGGIGIAGACFIWLCFFACIVTGVFSVVPATGDGEYLSFAQFMRLAVPAGNTNFLMWIAVLTLGLSFGIGGILTGIRLIAQKKNRALRIGIIANTVIFLMGALVAIIAGIQTGRDFAVYTEIEKQRYDISAMTLEINEITHQLPGGKIVATGGIDFLNISKGRVHENGVFITYRKSKDSLFHVSQIFSANALDKNRALARAQRIRNTFRMNGSELRIDPSFSYPSRDGLRSQHVEYIIEVPESGRVKLNGKMQDYPEESYSDQFRVNDGYEDRD